MNRLTIKQRKLLYFALIVALLIPIILLGMPATESSSDSGGKLARMRYEYKLGESTLGQVDPSSATMNLILLGMRGIATDLLWLQANQQQETKDWAQLRSTVDSIILLQPHYIKVWKFQGWNLSYNVSAEWDQVPDRYYWVKEGTKFLAKGSRRNEENPELYWETGNNLAKKIGRSDEWRLFREYFRKDPEENVWKGGPDTDLNPQDKDNYLVARDWFQLANDWELRKLQDQHIMMRALFRSYPARSLIDYADARQREGQFDETTRLAWDDAMNAWTKEYGQEVFITPGGRIRLEASTPADVAELIRMDQNPGPNDKDAAFDVDADTKAQWIANYQNTTNYRYWRTRAVSEREENTMLAHYHIYRGEELFRRGADAPSLVRITDDGLKALESAEEGSSIQKILQALQGSASTGPSTFPELAKTTGLPLTEMQQAVLQLEKEGKLERRSVSQIELEEGMRRFAEVLEKYPSLTEEDAAIEEAMLAVLYWRMNFAKDQRIPENFPLKEVWDKHQDRLPDIQRLFDREIRGLE